MERGKEHRTLCKGFTYKNFTYTPVCWDKCQAKSGKLMFVANHIIVDWGPRGMWLSNCSEDVNCSVCDYATQVAWKINDTTMEHYHDKGLPGWFDGGLAPPRPRIILDKQSGPEQWDIWKLIALKNLGLVPDISQGQVVFIVTISFTIISHILYRLVSHFLLL